MPAARFAKLIEQLYSLPIRQDTVLKALWAISALGMWDVGEVT